MSFKDRARDSFRNFSRRFDPNKPPASSIDAVGEIPTINGGHPRDRPATTSTGTRTTISGTGSSGMAPTSTTRTTVSNGTGGSSAMSKTSPYHLRPPLLHRKHSTLHATTPDFVLPDLPWLCGTWHVTHSTLPMWKDKRNVRIQYTRLPGNKIDDIVTYQSVGQHEVHRVRGVDTPKKDGRYGWRGKGLLKVATSTWEVLGWGGGGPGGQEEWVVTYFNRTLFTPAGIDIYSRSQEGLSEATVAKLRKGLGLAEGELTGHKEEVGAKEGNFRKLVGGIFAVQRDGARDADEILIDSAERLRG